MIYLFGAILFCAIQILEAFIKKFYESFFVTSISQSDFYLPTRACCILKNLYYSIISLQWQLITPSLKCSFDFLSLVCVDVCCEPKIYESFSFWWLHLMKAASGCFIKCDKMIHKCAFTVFWTVCYIQFSNIIFNLFFVLLVHRRNKASAEQYFVSLGI